MHHFLERLCDPKNGGLYVIFGLYVLSIFFFANIYYLIYRHRRRNFIFDREILRYQKHLVRASLKHRARKRAIEARLLNEGVQRLQHEGIERLSDEDEISLVLKSGRLVLIRTAIPPSEPPEPYAPEEFLCSIIFYSADNERIGSRMLENWANVDVAELLNDMLQRVVDQTELIEEQLRTMKTGAADVWSFWDFLYFSTITQTTVGYGDILPNSALVRKWVCLQILVGCALLAVVLIVFAPH